jgi:hypothetical protein
MSLEIDEVLFREPREGRIGKDREVVLPLRREAFAHRANEVLVAPVSDSRLAIGRNVRAVVDTERCLHRTPPGERRSILALAGVVRMTGTAAGRREHAPTALGVRKPRNGRSDPFIRRHCETHRHSDDERRAEQSRDEANEQSAGSHARHLFL